MKANEAPEKIYLNPLLMEDGESVVRQRTFERQRDSQIEYVRTDVFIEKAENFIYSALNDGIMGTCNIEDFLRLFKNYMKGE